MLLISLFCNRGNSLELQNTLISGKIVVMKPQKQKDALTDLVEISASDVSDQSSNEGEVTDATGDKVTLDFKVLARKLLNAVRSKEEDEKHVRDYLENKDK